ncbi:MAG: OmpA family protein [Pseudomonadota bacterium]
MPSAGDTALSRLTRLHRVRRVRRVPPRFPFSPFGLAPALGLGLVFLLGLLPVARVWIELATERAAQRALTEVGAIWATPRVSGQWVTLEGAPPSRSEGASALSAVREARAPTLFGRARPATRVTERFTWGDAPAAPDDAPASAPQPTPAPAEPLRLDWTYRLADGVLSLDGRTPDEATRLEIIRAAGEAINPPRITEVRETIEVVGGAPDPRILSAAQHGIEAVSRCEDGVARYAGARFSLRCQAPESIAADIEAVASTELPFGEAESIEVYSSEAVASCELSISDFLGSTRIEFATGSAELDEASAVVLDFLAQAAGSCPGVLRVEGHTDNTGSAELNQRLSLARAEAVRAALIERGLSPDRLAAAGFGASAPLADNATERGRARNRRIEFRVVRASE